MEVVLVVNNLGGTSNLEMGVLVNSAIKHISELASVVMLYNSLLLAECLQLKVVRVIMGTLMTSLDMAGVSLTLMKLENDWIQYLGKMRSCCSLLSIAAVLYRYAYNSSWLAVCVYYCSTSY